MQIAFAIIAALTVVSAIAAMSLRNLVHCALCLAVPFAGWAQVLVYIGAVAILIVFAILLTRSSEPAPPPVITRPWIVGVAVAVLVFGVLTNAIMNSSIADREPP